jgi:hypothetical protein
MPDLGSWQRSDTPKNPCADWLWSVAGWVALHGPWVNGVDAYKEDDSPQSCKNGSCDTGLDAVNKCHVLCLSPLKRTKT